MKLGENKDKIIFSLEKFSYVCNQYTGQCELLSSSEGYPTPEECSDNCKERYECNENFGCYFIGYGVLNNNEYPDSTCNNECSVRYQCHETNGCSFAGYGILSSGYYSDWSCNNECNQIYTCDPVSGCTWNGNTGTLPYYATTGLTYENCITSCTIQSYTCDASSGCSGRYDDSGEFSTYDCNNECDQIYTCDPASGCTWNGSLGTLPYYATTGLTYENCITSCTIQSYACDTNSGCLPRYDNSGSYSTFDCNNECNAIYECNQSSGCMFVGYGIPSGEQYSDYLCNSECGPIYECNQSSGCTFVSYGIASTGQYSDYLCNNECGTIYECNQYGCQFIGYGVPTASQYTDSNCGNIPCEPTTCCDEFRNCLFVPSGSGCFPTGSQEDDGCHCDSECYTNCFDCCGQDAIDCCTPSPEIYSLWDDPEFEGLVKISLSSLERDMQQYSINMEECWGAAMQSGSSKDSYYITQNHGRISLILCLQEMSSGTTPWVAIEKHQSRIRKAGEDLRKAKL